MPILGPGGIGVGGGNILIVPTRPAVADALVGPVYLDLSDEEFYRVGETITPATPTTIATEADYANADFLGELAAEPAAPANENLFFYNTAGERWWAAQGTVRYRDLASLATSIGNYFAANENWMGDDVGQAANEGAFDNAAAAGAWFDEAGNDFVAGQSYIYYNRATGQVSSITAINAGTPETTLDTWLNVSGSVHPGSGVAAPWATQGNPALMPVAKAPPEIFLDTEFTAPAVKLRYEANPDTNAFDDAAQAKLQGIEAGAQANTLGSLTLDETLQNAAASAASPLGVSQALREQILEIGRRSEFHTGGFTFNRTYVSADLFGDTNPLEQIVGLASHGNVVYAISPNGLVGGTDGSLQDIGSTIPAGEVIAGFARVDSYAFVTTNANIRGYRVAANGAYTSFYTAGVTHVVSADVLEGTDHTLVVMHVVSGQTGQQDRVELAFYTISDSGLGAVQSITRTLAQINADFSTSLASYDEFRAMSVVGDELYIYVVDDYHVRTLRYDISGAMGSRVLTANPDGGHNTTWVEFLTGVVRDADREYISSRYTVREYLRESSELNAVLAAIRAGTNVDIDRNTEGQITISATGTGGGPGVDLATVLAAIMAGSGIAVDRNTDGQITLSTNGRLAAANNLSDVINAATALANLGGLNQAQVNTQADTRIAAVVNAFARNSVAQIPEGQVPPEIARLAGPTFTGVVNVPDSQAGDNTARAANTRYVVAAIAAAVLTGGSDGVLATAEVVGTNIVLTLSNGTVLNVPIMDVVAGLISGVAAGAGLTGGGSAGDVTLAIATGGVTYAMLAAAAVTTLRNGLALLTGAVFTGQTQGITPVADADFTTKGYVDGLVNPVTATHTRYAALSADNSFNAADFTAAGTSDSSTTNDLTVPAFADSRYLAFTIPNTQPDLTSIREQGSSFESFTLFERVAGVINVGGEAHKVWRSQAALLPNSNPQVWVIT